MSETATTTETVQIPGELKLSNPIPPPMTISLPIAARPRRFVNIVLSLLAFLSGATLAPLGVGCLLLLPYLEFSWGFRQLIADGLVIAGLPLFLACGVMFFGAALTCFADSLRSKETVLEITADGLRDRRSGLSVAWLSVRCARILYGEGGMVAVDLQLCGPVTHWQNPFRIGVLLHRYCPKPDHVIVSVAYLNVRAHVLAYSILTLTQWNGGEAISKTPWPAFDMGLKVIPRKRV